MPNPAIQEIFFIRNRQPLVRPTKGYGFSVLNIRKVFLCLNELRFALGIPTKGYRHPRFPIPSNSSTHETDLFMLEPIFFDGIRCTILFFREIPAAMRIDKTEILLSTMLACRKKERRSFGTQAKFFINRERNSRDSLRNFYRLPKLIHFFGATDIRFGDVLRHGHFGFWIFDFKLG